MKTVDVKARMAIEALRSGVPNRAAVAEVGSTQARIAQAFNQLALETATSPGVRGMLVAGDFGAGKSHQLYQLRQDALELGFATAHVAISKETPLSKLNRVVAAAAADLTLPEVAGRGLDAAAGRAKFNSLEWIDFCDWVENWEFEQDWWRATVEVWRKARSDSDIGDVVLRYWAGEPTLTAAKLREAARELRLLAEVAVGRPPATGPVDWLRLTFLSQFVQGLGCRGLVLFVDEVELIAQFSRLQRLDAYRNLGRLLGRTACPELEEAALLVVGAVTSDFDQAVLRDKRDFDSLPVEAEQRRGPGEGNAVVAGMEAIRDARQLEMPTEEQVADLRTRVEALYARAYPGWSPPPPEPIRLMRTTRMRTIIRRWITSWDLRRYFGHGDTEVVTEDIGATPVDEDPDLGVDDAPGGSTS